jgi:hypothetical protein
MMAVRAVREDLVGRIGKELMTSPEHDLEPRTPNPS